MNWWRAYSEAVDDPKLMILTDEQHRFWFNILCVFSLFSGSLPTIKMISLKLRMQERKVRRLLAELIEAGLLDDDNGLISPHNWNGRQYHSDVSTERVRRFRERQRNVSCDVSETPPDTDTDTDTEDKKEKYKKEKSCELRSLGRQAATVFFSKEKFEEFWSAYPRRDGSNPKAPALKKFQSAIKSGAEADAIVSGACRYAGELREKSLIGTPYVAQAVTWLNQQRWNDYPGTGPPSKATQPPPGAPTDAELRAKYDPSRKLPSQNQKSDSPEVLPRRNGHDPTELGRLCDDVRKP